MGRKEIGMDIDRWGRGGIFVVDDCWKISEKNEKIDH